MLLMYRRNIYLPKCYITHSERRHVRLCLSVRVSVCGTPHISAVYTLLDKNVSLCHVVWLNLIFMFEQLLQFQVLI